MEFLEQKRGLVNALTNTLRTSRLVDMLNAQEAAAAFAQVLDTQASKPNNAAGLKPLDIAQFYSWLVVEKKLPKDVVAETLLFLKSREARYQVDLVLPKEVREIDEVTRQRIIQEFVQRGASTSGVYAGVKPGDLPKEVSSGGRPAPQPSGSKAPPAPVPPSAAKQAAATKPARAKRPIALVAAFLVVAAASGGITLYMQGTAPKPGAPLTADVPGALPCVKLTGRDGYALCTITTEQFTKMTAAELKRAALITRQAVAAQGQGTALTVITREDNQVRGAY